MLHEFSEVFLVKCHLHAIAEVELLLLNQLLCDSGGVSACPHGIPQMKPFTARMALHLDLELISSLL